MKDARWTPAHEADSPAMLQEHLQQAAIISFHLEVLYLKGGGHNKRYPGTCQRIPNAHELGSTHGPLLHIHGRGSCSHCNGIIWAPKDSQ